MIILKVKQIIAWSCRPNCLASKETGKCHIPDTFHMHTRCMPYPYHIHTIYIYLHISFGHKTCVLGTFFDFKQSFFALQISHRIRIVYASRVPPTHFVGCSSVGRFGMRRNEGACWRWLEAMKGAFALKRPEAQESPVRVPKSVKREECDQNVQ